MNVDFRTCTPMSTTATKRTLAHARADAEDLRGLFAGTYAQWHVAGSVRRGVSHVGDVEHVVLPRVGEVAVVGGLFPERQVADLLLHRADLLTQGGLGGHPDVSRHVYSDGRGRWGERRRGLSFRGFAHELFIAAHDGSNLGPTLAMRTGPSTFSKRLVTGLLRRGLRNHQGHVWECDPCPTCSDAERVRGITCPRCDGTRLLAVRKLRVPDERAYFELCGVRWAEPHERT